MTEYIIVSDFRKIYDYYRKATACAPCCIGADYDLWLESFASDTDYDGEEMFSELVTCAAVKDSTIVGFVQYGLSLYIYGTDGEKDRNVSGGIIRNLYFDEDSDCADELIAAAHRYFDSRNIKNRFAFFHAFGMTCNACHGKLFCGLPHIEKALLRAGYTKEHENVYYSRTLRESGLCSDGVEVIYGEENPKGLCEFSIHSNGQYAGAGAIVFLPQRDICYLKWIYIEGAMQGRGLASSALRRIFSDMYRRGIVRMDTDTADGNFIAQRLYTKTGFEDMGRTRSYMIQGDGK